MQELRSSRITQLLPHTVTRRRLNRDCIRLLSTGVLVNQLIFSVIERRKSVVGKRSQGVSTFSAR